MTFWVARNKYSSLQNANDCCAGMCGSTQLLSSRMTRLNESIQKLRLGCRSRVRSHLWRGSMSPWADWVVANDGYYQKLLKSDQPLMIMLVRINNLSGDMDRGYGAPVGWNVARCRKGALLSETTSVLSVRGMSLKPWEGTERKWECWQSTARPIMQSDMQQRDDTSLSSSHKREVTTLET